LTKLGATMTLTGPTVKNALAPSFQLFPSECTFMYPPHHGGVLPELTSAGKDQLMSCVSSFMGIPNKYIVPMRRADTWGPPSVGETREVTWNWVLIPNQPPFEASALAPSLSAMAQK